MAAHAATRSASRMFTSFHPIEYDDRGTTKLGTPIQLRA